NSSTKSLVSSSLAKLYLSTDRREFLFRRQPLEFTLAGPGLTDLELDEWCERLACDCILLFKVTPDVLCYVICVGISHADEQRVVNGHVRRIAEKGLHV